MFCFDHNVKSVYMDFNKYVKTYNYVLFPVSLKDKKKKIPKYMRRKAKDDDQGSLP